VSDDPAQAPWPTPLPAIPASSGALIFDRDRRLLILKPTYKKGWTIPGGVMEADGETPWEACQREVREECGLRVREARLACVDFRRPRPPRPGRPGRPGKPGRPGGMRFLFDCGTVGDAALDSLVLQDDEIAESRLLPLPDALSLLSKPVRRRVRATTRAATRAVGRGTGLVYLEDGRPVEAVRAA
jgi:8-oxo-dGTP diphosphatase